jgi:hypothetical protein
MKTIIVIALLISNAFASSRVETLLHEDASTRLTHIEEIQNSMLSASLVLVGFEKALESSEKIENCEKIFVKIRNVAAVTSAISLAITGRLILKKGPPSEGRLYNLLLAYGGVAVTGVTGVVATGGELGVYFSKNDAKELRIKINDLQTKLHAKNIELNAEIKLLCKDDPRHKLCY